MGNKEILYSIVSTVRNEVGTIGTTLDSVVKQSITPTRWVIINDGSTDGTQEILSEYENRYDWIEIINFDDKGFMDYESAHKKLQWGLKRILSYRNDFIVKLDADISFNEEYFDKIFSRFDEDPKLGIAGGFFYVSEGGQMRLEDSPAYHVRGGSKIYRIKCWEAIGGFVNKLGYDMIDEIQANMKGWKTRSFPDIKVIHHRKTGGTKGPVGWNIYAGKLNYLVWYHPLYMVVKSIKIAATQKPYLFTGFGLLYGFVRCYFKRMPRSIYDPEFKKYIRRQQLNRITFRNTIWK